MKHQNRHFVPPGLRLSFHPILKEIIHQLRCYVFDPYYTFHTACNQKISKRSHHSLVKSENRLLNFFSVWCELSLAGWS